MKSFYKYRKPDDAICLLFFFNTFFLNIEILIQIFYVWKTDLSTLNHGFAGDWGQKNRRFIMPYEERHKTLFQKHHLP